MDPILFCPNNSASRREDVFALAKAMAPLFSIRLKNFTVGKKLELAIGIFLILICISTFFYNPRIPNIQLLQWGLAMTGIICIISKFYTEYKIKSINY